jgi:Spy/CpxP family protein refolding chaperone
VVADFTRELSLTSDQQRQLASVVDETRAKWRALYAPLDEQHELIRQQGREKIRAFLTPEQRPKFEEFLKRLDEQRKKDQAIR